MHIPILYQDPDLLVIDKPAGIPTHAADPADPYPSDALRIVQAQAGLGYLGMHQRLDADTSGVLAFAARREANRGLAAAFEAHAARKVYVALVHGTPRQADGLIDAAIVRDRGERYRVTSPNDPHGLAAQTRYRVLSTVRSEGFGRAEAGAPRVAAARTMPSATYSLLEISPETGRSHQIRLHLAHIGCPVVGDPLYGPADRPAPRLCLHAQRLTLPHPTTHEPITFTAPTPALFERLTTGLPELALAASGVHVRGLMRFPDALRALLRLAVERRTPLRADPGTSIYRLVNGAADGLLGLTVDRFGEALVVSLYDDDGRLPPQPIPPALVAALAEVTGAQRIYVKYRPKQASRLSDDQMALLTPPQPVYGPDQREFVAHEGGLTYLIRPGDGLSSGLFSDMRESRGRVRAWAEGRRVLNGFAYTCGFGVAAMAGGAQRVLNLDLAKVALAWGQDNYRANGFEPDAHDFIFGDVFDWLVRLARRDDRFDLVILDPPGFSRTKSRKFAAAQDYGELAVLAARCVAPGGRLLACCNVAELPWRSFRDRLLSSLADAGRPAKVGGVYHEPAIDFPAPPAREPYLKMVLLDLA